MPIAVAAKNAMLNELGTLITHIGILDAGTPITAVTGTASTNVFAKTAHGLSNGDLVVLTEMSGGTGLIAGDAGNDNGEAEPLWVINANANDFQLSRAPGGSAVDFTSDITAVKVTELVEVSGGSPAYARKAAAWAAAAAGAMDESTGTLSFDMPAGSAADYGAGYSALTAGTLYVLDKLAGETFVGQGVLDLTDADLDLNG